MSESPVNPKYETSDYGCYEFDPQLNFSQFLEEARQHARDINFQPSTSCSDDFGKKRLGGAKENKKSAKSWKNSLLSWWKIDRTSKTSSNLVVGPNISKPTKGYGSGPLRETARGVDTPPRRPSSGPVSILFNPTRKVKVPYMCLEQPNDPYQINAYGTVYLVT